MSWRKGARRPRCSTAKGCRDRIAAATTQSTNHYTITARHWPTPANSSLGCRRAAQDATGVRLKIQLKDELAKRSPTPRCSTAKGCRDRIAAATTQSTNHYTITARHWPTSANSSLGCRRAAQGATGVRLKIQLKDELAKRSPTPRCSTAKGCRDRFEPGLLRPQRRVLTTIDHGVPLAHACKQVQRRVCPVQRGAQACEGRAKRSTPLLLGVQEGWRTTWSAGFEPARETPMDFKSIALTTGHDYTYD
ncbi:hypothetical protein G5714_024636 [Onychostoma macrolepis]|uniref:Uncharacterized protein n=1 Tax=Onychostoma macrolepis TaxID=369639 RepID=A0A7J6BIC6_9TELE|nr:hypothetical protein G5714_024636 [Onychostoma macrolepis]